MLLTTHAPCFFFCLLLYQSKQHHQEETVPGDHTLISWDEAVCGRKGHKEIWAWVRAWRRAVCGVGGALYCIVLYVVHPTPNV